MKTALLPPNAETIELAAKFLNEEQVVGIPTETVYGLAANAFSSMAVSRIFKAKGRPQDNPLIVHIADIDMLSLVAQDIPPQAYLLADAFWPGPLTIILPRTKTLADEVCAGLDTVGVRMPAHPVAKKIIQVSGLPLAAPSANRSGTPSPTTAKHVFTDMQGRIPLVVDGGDCAVGVESTVITLADVPTILRPGYITLQDIESILGGTVVESTATRAKLAQGEKPASPGMKYRHYAPKATLTLVDSDTEKFTNYVNAIRNKPAVWAMCFEGEEEGLRVPYLTYGEKDNDVSQAKVLFAALRSFDETTAQNIYVRSPRKSGIALAIYNRLLRAAEFKEIKL